MSDATPPASQSAGLTEERVRRIRLRLNGDGYVAGDIRTNDIIALCDHWLASRPHVSAGPEEAKVCEMCGGFRAVPSSNAVGIEPCPACNSSPPTAVPKSVAKRIAAQKGEPYPFAPTDGVVVPDVDWLAQVIRRADGNHDLGAGALAEAIVSELRALGAGAK